MTIDLPQKCPKCGEKKFRMWDSENNEMYVDWEKEIIIPAGTLIRNIKCSCCSRFDISDYPARKRDNF